MGIIPPPPPMVTVETHMSARGLDFGVSMLEAVIALRRLAGSKPKTKCDYCGSNRLYHDTKNCRNCGAS